MEIITAHNAIMMHNNNISTILQLSRTAIHKCNYISLHIKKDNNMLSKATPLLLTASPKITLHWSDGLLCIHFPYSLYPIQLITEVHTCS